MKHVIVKKDPKNKARFTIIVSSRVARSAVQRNKLKRRIRAIVESLPQGSHGHTVIARQGAPQLQFKELKEEVLSLLRAGP